MPRPRRFRRVLNEPSIRCFRPYSNEDTFFETIEINLEEYEAIRLKDYQRLQQKKAADIMGVSQPTFHRILTSAREKISKALVEGKIINIKGDDYIMDKKRYKCGKCGFEWYSPQKEYDKCPECDSEDISIIGIMDEEKSLGQPGLGRRRGFGGRGIGAGPPRACKCPQCGYESSKTPGVPCRNEKCPECGIPLCGAD